MGKESFFKTIGAGFLSALMLFSSADEFEAGNCECISPNNIHLIGDMFEDDEYDVLTEDEYNIRIKQKKKTLAVEKIRNGVLLTGSFVFSLIAKLILGLITAVLEKGIGASSNTLFGFTADCIMNFVIICALFSVAYKIIFPKRKLKELFTLKNIIYIAIASVAIEVVQNIMDMLFKRAYITNQICQCIINIVIIGFVWIKTFKLKGVFGEAVKKAMHLPYGKKIMLSLIIGNIFAVFIKVMLRNVKIISGYVQLFFVFVIAAFIVFCGCHLLRSRKNILILK